MTTHKDTIDKLPHNNFFFSNRYAGLFPVVITFLVYLPVLQNGFVNWDDQLYVYENPNIRSLDLQFFKWLGTAVVSANWHPLTMLSLALDHAVWGLDPFGYHLTNIVFHSINTLLVFILVYRLFECGVNPTLTLREREESSLPFKGRVGEGMGLTQNFNLIAASITALLFGIHPLHVESVVWISERKDILCAFFFLLSILAYLSYVSSERLHKLRYYYLSLICFILALTSKPMAVSLPVVLIILDCYPLNRLTLKRELNNAKILLEKAPFLVSGLISALIALRVQDTSGALTTIEAFPFITRISVAIKGYLFYLIKMVVPVNLAPIYPYPHKTDYFSIEYAGSIIILLTITTIAVKSSKSRLLSAVWFYYIATLLPVIGIVQVGEQAAADRYSYLPSVGPFLLIGLATSGFIRGHSDKRSKPLIPYTFLLLLIIILGVKTVQQIEVWQHSISLWSHQIKVFPLSSYLAYNNRGLAYKDSGKYEEAIADFDRTIDINPLYATAYVNRGSIYGEVGYNELAISDFTKAIKINPRYPLAYFNRGVSYSSSGEYSSAISDYTKAIGINPQYWGAYTNRGTAYYKLGYYTEAIKDLRTAIALLPSAGEAYYNLGLVYSKLGDDTQAAAYYKIAAGLGLRQARDLLNQ